jgi:hypothetical protein
MNAGVNLMATFNEAAFLIAATLASASQASTENCS